MTTMSALIFDCDGVLFESQPANLAYYNRIFQRFGYPAIDDPRGASAKFCHTASSPVVLERFVDVACLDAALAYAATLDFREFVHLMTEAPRLKENLTRLAERLPLAVATNRGDSMWQLLAHFKLADFFQTVVTCRDVVNPKPAPDMLILAAARLAVRPQDCVFVGDSDLDRQAARGAGMKFIAYGTALEEACRVTSHTELAALLLDLGSVSD
ncbi:MAG: HAD family phosphatase [Deltaproteobacteria bacterium]|nr:HAD family phosphatase [Deltaproteobacteria bacterium]